MPRDMPQAQRLSYQELTAASLRCRPEHQCHTHWHIEQIDLQAGCQGSEDHGCCSTRVLLAEASGQLSGTRLLAPSPQLAAQARFPDCMLAAEPKLPLMTSSACCPTTGPMQA